MPVILKLTLLDCGQFSGAGFLRQFVHALRILLREREGEDGVCGFRRPTGPLRIDDAAQNLSFVAFDDRRHGGHYGV